MTTQFEQHIYTSGEREFTTVAVTKGLTEGQIIELEQNSLYFLPETMMAKPTGNNPVKYVFYRIDDLFVFGRGIYAGKDSMGRDGNYFFHNFIMTRDDFKAWDYHPVNVIRSLIASGCFLSSQPASLTPLTMEARGFDTPNSSKPAIDETQMSILLAALFAFPKHGKPVMARAGENDIFNALHTIYTLSPFSIRQSLGFDTYGYGAALPVAIFSLPPDDLFTLHTVPGIEWNLASGSIKVNLQTSPRAELADNLSRLFMKDSPSLINGLLGMFDIFTRDTSAFLQQINRQNPEVRQKFYDLFKKEILSYILNHNDVEILSAFSGTMSFNSFAQVFSSGQILAQVLAKNDTALNRQIIKWILSAKNPDLDLLFASASLLERMFADIDELIMNKKFTYQEVRIPVLFLHFLDFIRNRNDEQLEWKFAMYFFEWQKQHRLEKKELKLAASLFSKLHAKKLPQIEFMSKFFTLAYKGKIKPDWFKTGFSELEDNQKSHVIHTVLSLFNKKKNEKAFASFLKKTLKIIPEGEEFIAHIQTACEQGRSRFEWITEVLRDMEKDKEKK
ncbi:MAG: hypothetical protein JW969_13375 [Spirochaetales bacterium]|nr:hypothetical protein [Spirochaetales bacterium]